MIGLAEPFRRVSAWLDAVGVPYVVVGSVAAAYWGVVRSTRDIDVVVIIGPRVLNVEGLLADDLYVPTEQARLAMSVGGTFNVLHPRSGGKVDVFVASTSDAFERQRMLRRVRGDVFGVDAWVASPEDVVLSKLAWRRSTGSTLQWNDCVELVSLCELDLDYLRRWAPHLGVADDLRQLLAEEAG